MVRVIPRPKRSVPERPVIIQSGDLCLEGLWIQKEIEFLPCIINSPHPRYGGTMDSPVLNELAFALANQGVTNLRFNYRGTGASQGQAEGGMGEIKDMVAAINFLLASIPENHSSLVAAGYSFGSWVASQVAIDDPHIRRTLLIAPPILNHDFQFLAQMKTSWAILVGDRDKFCPLEDLEKLLEKLADQNPNKPPVYIVSGASHYFVRGLQQMGAAAMHYLCYGKFPEKGSKQWRL